MRTRQNGRVTGCVPTAIDHAQLFARLGVHVPSILMFQVRAIYRAANHLRTLKYFKKTYILPTMTSSKLDCPQFKAILTPELIHLESLFTSKGYGFRLVGGIVRDLLLGKEAKDIDIATDCTPDAMMELFEENGIRYIPTGLQHGTITVHTEAGTDYEVPFS